MNSTLRLVDRWFRIAGIATIALLAVTVAMLLAGVEGWRAPFGLAHLAALAALLPLGIALIVHAYREAGGLGAMVSRHRLVVGAFVVIAVCVVVTQVTFTAYPAVRRVSNYVNVSIILLLIAHYLGWSRRLR